MGLFGRVIVCVVAHGTGRGAHLLGHFAADALRHTTNGSDLATWIVIYCPVVWVTRSAIGEYICRAIFAEKLAI